MSTKLVKKQLQSLIEQQVPKSDSKGASKSKEKRRQASLKKKQKQLQKEAQAKRSERLVYAKNLKYYSSTKGTSDMNAELMSKLLATVTPAK
jgi:hypothetical protein